MIKYLLKLQGSVPGTSSTCDICQESVLNHVLKQSLFGKLLMQFIAGKVHCKYPSVDVAIVANRLLVISYAVLPSLEIF